MSRVKFCLRFGVLASVILMAVATQSRATMYDLSAPKSSVTVNGAVFMTADIAPTGSGVIDSFVRVHAGGDEEGYNTDAKKFAYDEVGGAFTHSLLLSKVPQVQLTLGGAWFYEFGLDINQTNNDPLLSFDRLMIFRETLPSLESPPDQAVTLGALGTPLYNLDVPDVVDNWIKLNYLNPGSGQGDMYAYIPTSALAGGTGAYVYLYSMFGAQAGDYRSNDGFEEWFVRGPTEPPRVPAPAAVLLGMLGMGTAGWRLRRFA